MSNQPHNGSPPIFEFINGLGRVESSEETGRETEETINASRPSVHTASFHQQSSFHATETNNSNQFNAENSSNNAVVSADQERQVLLLMLLAQVCALHDATPKTFTIHVVELYERGLLNRDSINFLFELGLVPSISPAFTAALLEVTRKAPSVHSCQDDCNSADGRSDENISTGDTQLAHPENTATYVEIGNELALTTTTTTNTHAATKLAAVLAASSDPQRSAEAYAIRTTLARYEQLQVNTTKTHATGKNPDGDMGASVGVDSNQPWEAKHFPLSLSRYQREFEQVTLLASGSFGHVFHATRKMDGCDYAIKKVDFDAVGYSNETIQEVVREVECLAKVSDHPNVVRYYTSWLEPSWMTGGQTVEKPAAATSPTTGTRGSPRRVSQRRKTQPKQRLLLTNPLQDLIRPGSLSEGDNFPRKMDHPDPSSERDVESSRHYNSYGSASFESEDLSSAGMWQRRRFSFGSDVDSSDQSWGSYHEHSLEGLERATFDEDDDSSSSIRFMQKTRSPQNAFNTGQRQTRNMGDAMIKPAYRYQLSLYIQMQLCHPATLADWIRERNSKVDEKSYEQRIAPALEIFEQITKGLAHVHGKDIIHRDLKPANIFASGDGQVIKIGDFGLSKQLQEIRRTSPKAQWNGKEDEDCAATAVEGTAKSSKSRSEHWNNAKRGILINTNILTKYRQASKLLDPVLTAGIGTRSYAAPEQLFSTTYSTAADIFSLGLILLELVCCFETEHERLHNFQQCRQQEGVQPWLREHCPDIADIIIACTRPDPVQRPSANDILEMILACRLSNVTSAATAATPATTQSKHIVHSDLLRAALNKKDQELEQKDREIEYLRQEIAKLKAYHGLESEKVQ